MQDQLTELNQVVGVRGSFVCDRDGQVIAQDLPALIQPGQIALVARVVHQTLDALARSGQRLSETDLVFGNGRLLARDLRGGILVILCERTINVPLVNLSANAIAKKLSAELKSRAHTTVPKPRPTRGRNAPAARPLAAPEPQPPPAAEIPLPTPSDDSEKERRAPAAIPAPQSPPESSSGPLSKRLQRFREQAGEQNAEPSFTPAELQPLVDLSSIEHEPDAADGDDEPERPSERVTENMPPELVEQDREARRLILSAAQLHLTLRALGTIAIHWHCHRPHPWLGVPQPYHTLEFCGLAKEADALLKQFPQWGYQPEVHLNTFDANRRLVFASKSSPFRIQLFLDAFDINARLDVSRSLQQDPVSLSPTLLFLTRLQAADITELELREVSALCLDHELDAQGGSPDKISLPFIQQLCAKDRGWYTAIWRNLAKLNSSAAAWLDESEKEDLTRWIQRLSEGLEQAPKSLGWRIHARTGESQRQDANPSEPNLSKAQAPGDQKQNH